MKTKLIAVLLVSLLSFAIEAKPKKKNALTETFVGWTYTENGFHATQTSPTEAILTNDYSDGIAAPLPIRIIQGELSDSDFRNTAIFITDNLSEAFFH